MNVERAFRVEHRRITTPRYPVDKMFQSGRVVGHRDLSRFPAIRERVEAVRIAREVINRPGADPDCDACVMARQLLRALHVD